LAILTPNVSGVEVIPIEAFTGKPLINKRFPVLGHIVYPRQEITKTFDSFNPKTMSGVVRELHPAPTAGGRGVVGIYWKFGPEQRYFSVDASFSGKFFDSPCPLVFGREPRRARFNVLTGKPSSINVVLPSNGIDEPELPGRDFDFGHAKFSLQPEPWISPIFPIFYRLEVKGPKALYRARLDTKSTPGSEGKSASFEMYLEPGHRTFLPLEDWPTHSEVTATFTQLSERKEGLVVDYIMPSGTSISLTGLNPPWFRFKSADGTFFEADFDIDSYGSRYIRNGKPGLAGIQIGAKRYKFNSPELDCYGASAGVGMPFCWDAENLVTSTKTRVPAVIFTEGPSWTEKFKFTLPSRKRYCGH